MHKRLTLTAMAVMIAMTLVIPPTVSSQSGPVSGDGTARRPPSDEVMTCTGSVDAAWAGVESGDVEAASTALDTALQLAPCDPVVTETEWHYLLGRLALLQGDPARALGELGQAREDQQTGVGERPTDAEILYYLVLAHQASGQVDRALVLFADLTARHPADARVALSLPWLPQQVALSARERLDAAIHAVDSQNYSAAERFLVGILTERLGIPVEPGDPRFLEALGQAISRGDDLLGETAYQLGYLWYYWIRTLNHQAPGLLSTLAASDHSRRADASYYLARSYMRLEDYDAARQAWATFGEQFPRDERRHEAVYYSGWLYLDREQFAESLPGFTAYLDRYPRGERADRARWYIGWANFRLGRYSEARSVFHRMAGGNGYLSAAKGAYWEARCFQEEAQPERAQEIFSATAERFAFTYYGLLARQRLGEPLVPPREHTPIVSPTVRLGELATRSRELSTLEGLIEANAYYRALRYYDATNPGRGIDDWLDSLLLQHAVGEAYRGWREAHSAAGAALRRPPTERTLRDWVVSYPRPYTHWVEAAAGEFGLDPLLVWAHMQIESHYNATYISYADAEGLMQIIPKTGQLIAMGMGEPYGEGMLMNLPTNLRYASWYLAALIREFAGQLPLAIAAYNSGAHSMQTWVDENGDLEFDAFIEEISYDQSREYVKRVIGIYAHYLYLYADDETLAATLPRLLPERIDTGYAHEVTW